MRAILRHSGNQPGNDAVFDAALRRSGVIRIYNISQLYVRRRQKKRSSPAYAHAAIRLAIITNGAD